ncbi:MAG TPA: TonB-dependent receptor [Bryobacteraceae bacterium]|nr:TonB-dependent receptor [Bryobacteraceae bacterium]
MRQTTVSAVRVLVLLGSATALVQPTLSQEFRAILSGTVKDPTGAVVAGAKIHVTDVARNTTADTQTNESGYYTVPFLVPSQYRLTVDAPGFKEFVRDNIVLAINDRVAIDVHLELGQASQKVTVSGAVSTLQTETASRGGIISSQFVNDIPNDGRDLFNLVFAMPGAYKPSTSQNNEFSIDAVGNADPSINGNAAGVSGRSWNTEVLVNGITDVSGGNNNLVMTPGLASVQELTVMTATYDAQYGRTGGGFISVTTKSGTDDFHGQIFERLYNSALAANSWSNNHLGVAKSVAHTSNYGFEVDGPVLIPKLVNLRDKLFFMVSMDRTPSNTLATRFATVPLPGMASGDFSGLLTSSGAPITIYDPATTRPGPNGTYIRDPFPGNTIPVDRINPVGAAVLSYFPPANSSGIGPAHTNNFVGTTSEITLTPQWLGRMDYRLSDKNAFYGEYGETYYTRNGGFIWGNNAADPTAQNPRGVRGRHLAIDWASTLSPTFTFDLRAGFSRQENTAANQLGEAFNPAKLGFPQSLVSQMAYTEFPSFSFSNYNALGSQGYFTGDDSYDIQATASKVFGNHITKFGADLRRFLDTSITPGAAAGSYTFNPQFTQANPLQASANSGNDIADLLLGYPSAGSIQILANPAYTESDYIFFFQDDWKPTPKLTLNLGLRWEYQTPEVERYNRQNRGFAFGQPSPIAAAVKAAPGAENCPVCQAGLTGGYLFAGASGDQRYAYNPVKNDWQPRIGVAWSVNSKTVLRAGFGTYKLGVHEMGAPDGFSSTSLLVSSLDGGLTPSATLSNPFPGGLVQPSGTSQGLATDLGLSPSFNYLNFKTPTSYQYSLGVQHELPGQFLLDVSFVGNYTNRLPVSYSLDYLPTADLGQSNSYYSQKVANPMAGLIPNNAGLNGATIPLLNLLYMYPQYSNVTLNNVPVGKNRYDSGQVVVSRRFANGFTFMANYTKSKTLMQESPLNAQDFNPASPLNSHMESRLATFDVPQRVSILGTYELPFGHGKRFGSGLAGPVNYIFGNWKLGFNITDQSGFPVQFPNAAPLQAKSAKLPASQQSLYEWFNTSLFPTSALAPYTLQTFPTVFPDVRFEGVHNVDMSLIKDLPIHERLRAQIRADFTNSFNHPYFTQLSSTSVTSPQFGQIKLSQNNDPRIIYMELKILF